MDRISTYWEGPVSWLERLSIRSMVVAGYTVDVFTPDVAGLKRAGLHDEIHDVREVMEGNFWADLYRARGNYAFYTDHLRLELLRQDRGIWADADCVFARSIPRPAGGADYVFGWLNGRRINNAVLYAPATSELVATYAAAITARPIRAPWATGHIRVKRALELAIGKTMPFDPDRLAIGPRALTYFVRRLGLAHHARPRETFYPLPDDEAHLLAEPDHGPARERIGPDTVAVHAWRGKLWSIGRSDPPPPSSWLGRRCRALDV